MRIVGGACGLAIVALAAAGAAAALPRGAGPTGTPAPTLTASATPAPTPSGGIAGSPTPTSIVLVPLGHFVGYQAKVAKSGPKFFKIGPVTLADPNLGFTADYDVVKPDLLALPADRNGEGFTDPVTHLVAYAVKPAKGSARFHPRGDFTVTNQCGAVVLTVKKPTSMLVPTGIDVVRPAPHHLDHFLCYQAKTQKKRADGTPVAQFPKGVQAEVGDAFQTRRYDLKQVASVCLPVAKSGTPRLLAGPDKGAPFALEPATVGSPHAFLVCYRAKLATRTIPQHGCGAVDPDDKGTKIVPPQPVHVPRLAVQIGNQLGGGVLATKKETLVCVPSADFTPGTVSTVATLDSDGRLSSAITLMTDHGVTAHLDAGTEVHGLDGEAVQGDVDIVLDDGGGAAAFGGPDPIQGTIRLLVRRRGDGTALRVDFDPPVTVDLELDAEVQGSWLAYSYADSDGFVTGPAAGAQQIPLGPLGLNDDDTGRLVFENTMVMGLRFVADPASTAAVRAALTITPSTVSVPYPIPGDPPDAISPDARVCYWEVDANSGPPAFEILVVDSFVQQPPVPRGAPGFGVGESRTKTIPIHGRSYTATLVDRGGGQRALEVTSTFHNRLVLDFRLCNPDGTRFRIRQLAEGGCADEACTELPYDGLIAVTATGRSIADGATVRDALRRVTGGGNLVVLHAGRALPNGRFRSFIKVLSDEPRSVQVVAAELPGEWATSTTDRRIDIVIPTPGPTPQPGLLGEWSGRATILDAGVPISIHDARVTVQQEGNGLRIWFCNAAESSCAGPAQTQECALQFTATAAGTGFAGTGVDNNSPCCIGCVGQNRVYGCAITATLSAASGQLTLEGDIGGGVTFCPGTQPVVTTHFEVCRPPCPAPTP